MKFAFFSLLLVGCQTLTTESAEVQRPNFVAQVLEAHHQGFSSFDSPAVAWGTMTISSQQATWFCWYDGSCDQFNFLLDCEVGEEFETAVVKAVELVEGKLPIEDPRVVHVVDGLKINGQVWLPRGCTGTIFYFRCQEFTGEFFDRAVDELQGGKMKVEEIF